jgi:acyl carrier protein
MEKEFEKIRNIIADVLNVDPDEITKETTFADDLGADSLDLYQILMGIEEEFEVTVPQENVENIKTVGQALEMLHNTIGAAQ